LHWFSKITAAAAMIGLQTVGAQAGICERYLQTWSNAGQCRDCQLRITANPKDQRHLVEASNGWKAELVFFNGQSPLAVGVGNWKSGLGHVYSGHHFSIVLMQRSSELAMVMGTKINGQRQIIRAKFRCLDGTPEGSF
jgi:hypothetical protein